jgi:Protein of unknown function (DUF2950)
LNSDPKALQQGYTVSYEGVVPWARDLGPNALEIVREMELYNPDKTWSAPEPFRFVSDLMKFRALTDRRARQ